MNITSLALLVLLASASEAFGQQTRPDPASQARIHLGPVSLTPAIGLTNLGVDTNVFNEVTAPKRDVTVTVTPRVDGWVRLGRSRAHAESRVDLVYFARYAGERSANIRNAIALEVPLRRIRPFGSAQLTNTRERPGYEIDARSKRREYRLAVGNELRIGVKTAATVEASRTRIDFDADAVFDGTYLFEVLNRTEDALTLAVHHDVTPLTTVVLAAAVERSRFNHSSERDMDTLRVLPGLELAPSALISGNVSVGLRRSHPLDARAPAFSGVVGTANVAYVLLGATRVSLRVSRDLDYSYDRAWPYYISTGLSTTIRQRVATRWDVHVNLGRQGLAYQAGQVPAEGIDRRDRLVSVGGGTSYRFGPATRLLFSVDRVRRDSALPMHAYSKLQSGLTLSYGF